MIEYIPHPTDPTLVVLKVTKHYIAKHSDEDLQAAVLAEREACAKLCDDIAQYDGYIAAACAEEIRARGNV
jgi:hypothetical protein